MVCGCCSGPPRRHFFSLSPPLLKYLHPPRISVGHLDVVTAAVACCVIAVEADGGDAGIERLEVALLVAFDGVDAAMMTLGGVRGGEGGMRSPVVV